ncbi:Potassium channel subfamily K member 13 [Smittium mucronatum]|uniref:Potassium channel subfamily K member 13 n=1 Tax=Smittium mucronatum TaxID=133383 RepID=A0A1R0H970_9FUNG|nr:Potassium channel subfamily K member 13 [Smittium mucronatum]
MESSDLQSLSSPSPEISAPNESTIEIVPAVVDQDKLEILQHLTNIFDKPRTAAPAKNGRVFPLLYSSQEHKILKSRFRILVSIVGFLVPTSLLLNGIVYNSEWIVRKNTPPGYKNQEIGISSVIYAITVPIKGKYNEAEYELTFDYYTLFIGSFICLLNSGILLYDLKSTRDFVHFGSGMSVRQKKLTLSISAIYLWNAVGAGAMVLLEHYDFPQSLYFCLATINTIGFGDLYPTSGLSRAVLSIWFFIGLVLVGIYSVDASDFYRQMVYIHKKGPQESMINKRDILKPCPPEVDALNTLSFNHLKNNDQGEKNVSIHSGESTNNNEAVLSDSRESKETSVSSPDIISSNNLSCSEKTKSENGTTSCYETSVSNQKDIDFVSSEDIKEEQRERDMNERTSVKSIVLGDVVEIPPANDQRNLLLGVERLENFYESLKVRIILYLALINLANLLLSGAVFYGFEKGQWSYADALWFCFISFTTIGYGDRTLSQSASRTYFSFIIIFSVSMFSTLIILLVDQTNNYLVDKIKLLLDRLSKLN